MASMYTTGEYLAANQTWHTEDSPWKADQIMKIISSNRLQPRTIAEVGCGAGAILEELSRKEYLKDVQFSGYDISPQAIEMAKRRESSKITFSVADLLEETNAGPYDILLAIDVFEHVPDYMGFVEKCRPKATYKIFHIPLDVHVSSVLRRSFIRGRATLGHLHYFTAESALATVKDGGHEIIDYFYTNGTIGLFKHHPSFKRLVANGPRWLFSKFSEPLTATVFGGYSLLVLAK